MSLEKINSFFAEKLEEMKNHGVRKGIEHVITSILIPDWLNSGQSGKDLKNESGLRVLLEGQGNKPFILMNSNSYLGLSFKNEVISAEEDACIKFGTGPGAVRFISGTSQSHIVLEKSLATFHKKEAAMIFSSAYACVMGVIPPLVDEYTLVISDELNHNCIINAIRLSRPAKKEIYRHLDMKEFENILKKYNSARGKENSVKRVLVVTDGIFSMRGDHAPLKTITDICKKYEHNFEESIITIVDDSHGVGAFGKSGRGTEEFTGASVDILIGTLGKAFGVNGGYVATSSRVIEYLRETSAFYVYSNPITPSESAAALAALNILNSQDGLNLLEKLRTLKQHLETGFERLGFEFIKGEHPITPLMVRDTKKTDSLVQYLFQNGVLVTGLNYPVVPRGDEEIRFQVNAAQSISDLDYLLQVLSSFQS